MGTSTGNSWIGAEVSMGVAGRGVVAWASGMGFSLNGGCAPLFLNGIFLPQSRPSHISSGDGAFLFRLNKHSKQSTSNGCGALLARQRPRRRSHTRLESL
jgi:hypothetical protein